MGKSRSIKVSDGQLLDRFAESRDQSAFAELVRRHGPMVLGTARRVLRSEEDVEEAFQATMFALARTAGTLRKKSAVAGWLHKTAFRCAVDIHRSNRTWNRRAERMIERSTSEAAAETTGPLLGVANAELERILDEELASLSERLREVIVLCELEGMPQKEVAKQLGIPTSTVNDRFSKARRLLHSRLVRRGATLTLSGIAGRAALSNGIAMSNELVADITAKATLYANGTSAAEIGVSPLVTQIAGKTSISMIKGTLATVILTAMATAPLVGVFSQIVDVHHIAGDATIFIETFDDGDFADRKPVTWTPYGSSRLSIGADGLVVSGDGYPAAESEGLDLKDTSLKTELKLRRGDGVTVYVRTAEKPGRKGYAVFLTADGMASFRFDGTGELLDQAPTNINPMRDFVAMQIDAIGDKLRLWIWQPQDPRPVSPVLEVTDNSGFEGGIGIGALSTTGVAEAVFRLVHLADYHISDSKP